MREAEVHLMQLVNMLRRPGAAALPGTVAIVAVKAAGSIALQRPLFFSKVLPVFLAVASTQVRNGIKSKLAMKTVWRTRVVTFSHHSRNCLALAMQRA